MHSKQVKMTWKKFACGALAVAGAAYLVITWWNGAQEEMEVIPVEEEAEHSARDDCSDDVDVEVAVAQLPSASIQQSQEAQSVPHDLAEVEDPTPLSAIPFDLCYENTEQFLGSGGFGSVVVVRRKADGTDMACKSFKEEEVPFTINGLPLEIMILWKCSHPNIIQMVDAFHENGIFRIIMPYQEGAQDLHTWRADRMGVMDDEESLKGIFHPIAKGLEFLQEMLVVHSDLKPANILIHPDPIETNRYHVQIIDFGLAVQYTPGDNNFVLPGGTEPYMSPELGKEHTGIEGPESDMWSFGVIMWEVVYGSLPFDSLDEVMDPDVEAIPSQRAMGSRGRKVKVPPKLLYLLIGLLTKKPEYRLNIGQVLTSPWFTG